MKHLLAILALMALTGCWPAPDVIAPQCPAPPSATMLPPQALAPLPDRELTAREVLDLWAADIGLHKSTAARLAALQAWWRDHCGVQSPSP